MAKEKPRGFRFTRELLDALDERAAAEHRSVNNLVEVMLMEGLATRGAWPREALDRGHES